MLIESKIVCTDTAADVSHSFLWCVFMFIVLHVSSQSGQYFSLILSMNWPRLGYVSFTSFMKNPSDEGTTNVP
ncbi:hypothetical protein PMAYCL1PPCAC_23021, partial [Pristionchus mayeri]